MTKYKFFAPIFFVLIFSMTACRQNTQAPVNTQATIDAAVAATSNAQIAMQATIDEAVNATATAQSIEAQTLANAQATAVSEANPTPTATPVVVATEATAATEDTVATMTEDELAAMIDEAVADAYATSATYSDAASASAADGTVTQEETQTTDVYYADSEEAIAYAEALMQEYYDLYGELAYEVIDELNQLESDMQALTDAILLLNDTMTEIADLMEQGLAITEDVLAQLDSATQLITENVATAQAASEAWRTAYQSAQTARTDAMLSPPPTNVTADPAAALQSVASFAQLGQSAMADNKITPEELTALAQQGANATASLNATGNPKMQDLSGMINGVTGMLAAGDIPAAQANLSQLSMAMNTLNGVPGMGGVTAPSAPGGGSMPGGSPGAPSAPSKPR